MKNVYEQLGVSIPEFIPVSDVSDFLEISVQLVKKYCSEGKIIATQNSEGKWNIPVSQFESSPNWLPFIRKRLQKIENDIQTAEIAKRMWSRE